MIRKLILFLFLSLCSVSIMAERTSMTVYVPEIIEAAKVMGNQINMRKFPSPTAPQLMSQWEIEDPEGLAKPVWSDIPTPKGWERCVNQLYEGNCVLVAKQSGDWANILYDNCLPWVKKSFLSIDFIEKLGIGFPPAEYSPRLWLRLTGAYEDFCIAEYQDEYFPAIYIGYYDPERFRTHLALFPLSIEGWTNFEPECKGIKIIPGTTEGEWSRIDFGPDAALVEDGRNYSIDLSKLTDSQFNQLLNLATYDKELLIFAFDGHTHHSFIDPKTYTGELKKFEVPIKSVASSVQSYSTVDNTKIYDSDSVDTPPSFPGGMGAMMNWIGRNLNYPSIAQANGVMGRVLVKFVVSADGSIKNAQVIKSVDPDLDKEALRVISAMPKWKPGNINGRPVSTWMSLPVSFKLNY